MISLINKDFAIESYISSAYSNKGIMAIGYFLIQIKGVSYGVKENDATALANSYDAVIHRLEMRGKHIAPADLIILPSMELAQITNSSLYYRIDKQDSWEFSIPRDKLAKTIYKNNLIWAPDGDEAFDDGSRVFQFDIDDKTVRLIGYKTTDDYNIHTLSDLKINSNEFYSTLKEWSDGFYEEWQSFELSTSSQVQTVKNPHHIHH